MPHENCSFEERWAELEATAEKIAASGGITMKQRSQLANTANDLRLKQLSQSDYDRLLAMAARRNRPMAKPFEGGTSVVMKRDPFVVDGIFLHGLNLLVSAPGVGKSRMCASLAAAWLRGDPEFLLRKLTGPPTEERHTLIIGTDQNVQDWVRTLMPTGLMTDSDDTEGSSEMMISLHERVTLHTLETDTKLDDDGLNIIRRWCDQNQDCMVIIDSFTAVLPPGIDEEKPSAAQPLYALQEAIGSCWCIVTHHMRKAAGKEGSIGIGASRGSGAIDGAVSRLITLTMLHKNEHGQRIACETDPRRELLSTKRGGAPTHLIIDSQTWNVSGSAKELKEEERREMLRRELTEEQKECLRVLETNPQKWLTTREIVEALGVDWYEDKSIGGQARNSTCKRLQRLHKLGFIAKEHGGNDARFKIG